jgi:TRAP-type C4-dicarboxylate transport system substrate-binding protein
MHAIQLRSAVAQLFTVLALACALPFTSYAADPQLKIGSLVPKNSLYHRQLMEVGEAWKKSQSGSSRFNVFTDGSQGGEAEMVPSIAALQNLPLAFRSWEELDYVREKMRPGMEKKFLDKGYVVLAWGDAGWVRFFSKQAAFSPDDYKKMKFFAWGSEAEQQEIMKSMGYTPVPLEPTDILPSIQTGMINVVPSTPYFALASQIYNSAPNMLEINWAPIVGAFVISKKSFDEMSPETQAILKASADKAGSVIRIQARKEVEEAVDAMKKRGLQVNKPNAEQMKEWRALTETLYPRIRGKMVPAETFDEVFAHLKTYRASKTP